MDELNNPKIGEIVLYTEHDRADNAAINIELWSERPKGKAAGQAHGLVESGSPSPFRLG